jgi:zinc protease
MIPRILGLLAGAVLLFPAAARAIDIQEVTSPGGIEAWLVEDSSIPFVAVEIWFNGGASLDAPGKRGATYLMTGLLEEGAEDMDARAYAEAVEGLAASFEFDVFRDALTVSARMLTENRDEAADLLRAALVSPRFDEDAVERVRGQVLSILDGDDRDPDEIASRTFNAMAWGDHPYGSALEGTRESVSALTRDDLVDAHDAVLARDRVIVGAAGDITAEELGAPDRRHPRRSAGDRRAHARNGGIPAAGRAPPSSTSPRRNPSRCSGIRASRDMMRISSRPSS